MDLQSLTCFASVTSVQETKRSAPTVDSRRHSKKKQKKVEREKEVFLEADLERRFQAISSDFKPILHRVGVRFLATPELFNF
jgi:hypothetical protein